MATLYHHTLSPHARFVRLILEEYGVSPVLVLERPWERRREFLVMNPAATLPVFVDDDETIVVGAWPIAEYLDETRGPLAGARRLVAKDARARAEMRRLVDWFNDKFFVEVVGYLVTEKAFKREMTAAQGGGPPDTGAIRAGRANIRTHLRYLDYLIDLRNWLAGDRLSYADLAAAAQLSAVDYLDEVPWTDHGATKEWYARIKSRPSFRTLLTERVKGIAPPKHYEDLDF